MFHRAFTGSGMLLMLVLLIMSIAFSSAVQPVGEDAKDLWSLLWGIRGGQEEGSPLVFEPTVVNGPAIDAPVDLGPAFFEDVPMPGIPDGPAPKVFLNPNDMTFTKLSIEKIRNGWGFLWWYFYTIMDRRILDAQEYAKVPAASDQFLLELMEIDIWRDENGKEFYFRDAANLVAFDGNPEEGITVDAIINYRDGTKLPVKETPVTAVIRFEDGRWWLISVHRTH